MATTTEQPTGVDPLRTEWVGRVAALVAQVAAWAAAEGWPVEPRTEAIVERRLGMYDAPALTVYPPGGEVSVRPVALDQIGRTGGRVDVQAYPTFSRVMLLGQPDQTWLIMTDSNVPLRLPWTRATFAQLIADLLA